ncbi:MAG TPA: UPF0158 family protein [Polyangiaceae bacterium]|nr:UPF0158 family protein [Polyangiaceae bacterium]
MDWEALEDAFENNAPEVHSYLHVKTGEVLRVVDGIADPDMHARIAQDAEYMRVDPVSSREQYRWMERFIPMVEDAEIQRRLGAAIDGKGAFRRFKDVLMAFGPERERWFAFRSERLRVFMEAWLGTHNLVPIPRPVLPVVEEAPEAPPVTQEQLSQRRAKGGDALRTQLLELADVLPGRDLEKVVAFAEFLKARRAARAFSQRPDSSSPALHPASSPATSTHPTTPSQAPAAIEVDPPSQRRPAERR